MYYSKEQTATLATQTFAYLKITDEDNVFRIRLNRPHKKNALSPVLVNELAFALNYAKQHDHVRVVILEAEGTVFCSGADLKAFMGVTEPNDSTIPPLSEQVLIGELFNTLYKPCIAKVEGPAYAGAFLLLCGCTHVFAVEGVSFGLPEVKRGLWPMQVMAGLLRVLPARKVLDWCMRGYKMDAQEAYDTGFVSHLSSAASIEEDIQKLVAEICSNSPAAIRLGLEAFHHIQGESTKEQHAYLQEMLFKCLQTDDAQEGIMAFREKRKPVWK